MAGEFLHWALCLLSWGCQKPHNPHSSTGTHLPSTFPALQFQAFVCWWAPPEFSRTTFFFSLWSCVMELPLVTPPIVPTGREVKKILSVKKGVLQGSSWHPSLSPHTQSPINLGTFINSYAQSKLLGSPPAQVRLSRLIEHWDWLQMLRFSPSPFLGKQKSCGSAAWSRSQNQAKACLTRTKHFRSWCRAPRAEPSCKQWWCQFLSHMWGDFWVNSAPFLCGIRTSPPGDLNSYASFRIVNNLIICLPKSRAFDLAKEEYISKSKRFSCSWSLPPKRSYLQLVSWPSKVPDEVQFSTAFDF